MHCGANVCGPNNASYILNATVHGRFFLCAMVGGIHFAESVQDVIITPHSMHPSLYLSTVGEKDRTIDLICPCCFQEEAIIGGKLGRISSRGGISRTHETIGGSEQKQARGMGRSRGETMSREISKQEISLKCRKTHDHLLWGAGKGPERLWNCEFLFVVLFSDITFITFRK